MAGKNKISMKVVEGNSKISNTSQPDVKSYKEQVEKGKKRDKKVEPVQVISRLDHPEDVEYDGAIVRVSPRAKLMFGDVKKLSELPKGLFKKKLPKVSAKK